jgi:hypothetical protein
MHYRSFLLNALVLCTTCISAQPQWSVTLTSGAFSQVFDLHAASDGALFVLVGDDGLAGTRLLSVEAGSGAVIGESSFAQPPGYLNVTQFVGEQGEDLLLIGTYLDQWPLGPGDSTYAALYRVSPDFLPVSFNYGGLPGKVIGYLDGYQDSDGNIRMAYQCLVDELNPQQFKAVTFSPQGVVLDSAFLQETFSFPTLGSLHPLPNGNSVLLTSACLWGQQTTSQTMLVELNDAWGVEQVNVLPLANPGYQSGLSALGWPLNSLMLPSGNVVAWGQYWRSFGNDRGAALQRLTLQGDLLGQWEADSPFLMDIPAWLGGVDLGPDGNLYYAQLNNWSLGGQVNPWPSQVELFKMDTAFNVIGTYLLDGIVDSTFYFPSVVKATADGGLLVGGGVKDATDLNAPLVAWLAKFGPEDLVSVPERRSPLLGVYPNPGSEDFTALLMRPLPGAVLQVFDARGALVRTQPVTDLQQTVQMDDSPSGIYVVHLRDTEGAFVSSARWVKH